jgi:hypothetical protein
LGYFFIFVEPNPAVRYKLFSQNIFFYKPERASFGRFSASRKNMFSLKKAFHFHQGQEIQIAGFRLQSLIY